MTHVWNVFIAATGLSWRRLAASVQVVSRDRVAGDRGTVLVTHVEDVTGLLFPVFRAAMGSAIQKHHDNLNRALKERVKGPTPAYSRDEKGGARIPFHFQRIRQ